LFYPVHVQLHIEIPGVCDDAEKKNSIRCLFFRTPQPTLSARLHKETHRKKAFSPTSKNTIYTTQKFWNGRTVLFALEQLFVPWKKGLEKNTM